MSLDDLAAPHPFERRLAEGWQDVWLASMPLTRVFVRGLRRPATCSLRFRSAGSATVGLALSLAASRGLPPPRSF